jgi:hypothetical protein
MGPNIYQEMELLKLFHLVLLLIMLLLLMLMLILIDPVNNGVETEGASASAAGGSRARGDSSGAIDEAVCCAGAA